MPARADLQRLITENGYRPCPRCSGLLRPTTTHCPYCRAPVADNPVSSKPAKKSRRRLARPKETALGGLATLSDHRLTMTVFGIPVTQGSVDVPAPGVVKYSKALRQWRTTINQAAARACGPGWEAANCPLVMSAVFTLPRPTSAPKNRPIHAAVKPDTDKLIRALQDALAPRASEEFRVYTEDSRIVGYVEGPYKTYPAPLGTHPWALDQPGVIFAIEPAPPVDLRQDTS
ncbi:RusA family crossover junction endodeoxyribonuclease [Streptomyces sp. NPDC101455]|uniref:RusA family crossover junction endodeoxyribonuclease n=1 Tax=Streptomyces sp. NPDC101455 TaxID=3366142 RepID=UPI003825624E